MSDLYNNLIRVNSTFEQFDGKRMTVTFMAFSELERICEIFGKIFYLVLEDSFVGGS